MANLSKIMLPDGTTYDICDTTARASIKGERIWYGTCATGASTQNKVVTTNSGDFSLEVGSMVRVKFTNAFTYNGTSRLNVDSTGNIDIARVGTTETTRYYVSAGEVIDFVYDGTDFVMSRTGTATTTYYGLAKLATSAYSTSTSTALTPQSLNGLAQYMISGVEPFSTSKNYEMGDRVRYGYYIYQATSTVSAGAWNSAQWHALDPLLDMIETKADSDDIPTSTSELTNDSGFITSAHLPRIYVDGESRMIVGYIKTTVSGVEGIKLIYDDGVSPDGVEIFIPDGPGVTSVYQQIISQIPTKTSDLTNDSNFVVDASYVHTDNNYTTTEKNKLSGIAAGAQVNQNAFSNVRVGSIVVPALGTTDTLEIDASGGISITADVQNKTITFTGSGSPQVQSNWNETDTTSAAYIQNKPTIPSAPVQSNWNESDSSSLAYIQNKPTIPSAPVQSNWNESDSSSLAYIQNKPTIPTNTSQLNNDSHFCTLIDVDDSVANIIQMIPTGTNTVSVDMGITAVYYQVTSLPDTIFVVPWSQTSGRVYHPVLFDSSTGVIQLISYDHDNSEFSFITLTDNNNDSMTGYISTFTVPTKTSDLQNDSNFVVDASYVHTDNNFTTALKDSVEALANVGTVYNTSVTDVSVSSGTWKSIASLSLPKGTFLVNGNPRFGAVTNKGTRQMCLNTSSNANGTHGKVVIDFQATSGSGNVIGMQSSYIFSLSSPTTVYLNVYHTQGSALTVSAELQAVCISAGSTSYQSASGVGF